MYMVKNDNGFVGRFGKNVHRDSAYRFVTESEALERAAELEEATGNEHKVVKA